MREIVHIQAGQCGNQIGAKVCNFEVFRIFDLKIFGENSTKDVLEKLRCYRHSRFCSGNCCKDVRGGIFDVESGLIYKMFKMCVDIFDTSNYLVAFL